MQKKTKVGIILWTHCINFYYLILHSHSKHKCYSVCHSFWWAASKCDANMIQKQNPCFLFVLQFILLMLQIHQSWVKYMQQVVLSLINLHNMTAVHQWHTYWNVVHLDLTVSGSESMTLQLLTYSTPLIIWLPQQSTSSVSLLGTRNGSVTSV